MIFEGLENPKSYEYEVDDYDKENESSFINKEEKEQLIKKGFCVFFQKKIDNKGIYLVFVRAYKNLNTFLI